MRRHSIEKQRALMHQKAWCLLYLRLLYEGLAGALSCGVCTHRTAGPVPAGLVGA